MWFLGGAPIFILVLGTGIVAFGAAVSWIAFRTKGAFTLATALASVALCVGALAWWRGEVERIGLATVPFQIAAVVTLATGLVIALGELARSRRPPDDP